MHSSHKISKLIFEVSLEGDENQAKLTHAEVERFISAHITEVLDKSLSKFDNDEIDFFIDKLEIDIGSFDIKNDKEKLFREIAEKIEKEIQRIHTVDEARNESSPVKSEVKGMEELVFYILRNGHLPWWADFDTKVSVNDFFKQYSKQPNSKSSILLKKEVKNPVFRKRLINYLTEDELVGCVEVLIPVLIAKDKLIIEKCKTSVLFKEQFFDLLLQIPSQKSNEQLVVIIETTLGLLKDNHVPSKTINLDGLTLPENILSRLKAIQLSPEKLTSIDAKEKSLQEMNKKQSIKTNKEHSKHQDNTQTDNYSDEETENSIEISNAGLVLILPFLSHFFENIGIAKDKAFNSEVAQHYAVYLLHYIATDNQDLPQEHELFFEKLICGIDVNDVLKPCSSLEKEHQAEVEELLKAIVENWTALKSSSPQTLQTAFLQRPGYLIQRDDGAWSLHIERQTIDILLDRIPWTISIGRLPFSGMMIYTEW